MTKVSKKKQDIEKLKQRILERKLAKTANKDKKEETTVKIEKPKDEKVYTTYTVIEDPTKKGKHFLMVKLQFNPFNGESSVLEIREFEDRSAGMAFILNLNNLEILFNKNKKIEL